VSDDEREQVPNDVLASGQLTCPACGKPTEAVQAVEEGARPKVEDRTLCWTCGGVGIYHRTGLGYWSLRAPTADERAEIDVDEQVVEARRQLRSAKAQGRGPTSVGHFAGGLEEPPAPAVVIPAAPVDWEALRERHDLDRGTLSRLQDWSAVHVDSRPGPGSVRLSCGICEAPLLLGPTAQSLIFKVGAKVLCPVCVHLLQQRLAEEP
jgi:hypothetical protein